jgi:hypothetical protein
MMVSPKLKDPALEGSVSPIGAEDIVRVSFTSEHWVGIVGVDLLEAGITKQTAHDGRHLQRAATRRARALRFQTIRANRLAAPEQSQR